MITIEQVNQVIKTGLKRFEKPCKTTCDQIQIVFKMPGEEIGYMVFVNMSPVFTVTLKDLIGNNLFNFAINNKLIALFRKLIAENGDSNLNIVASSKEGEIYYQLRRHETIIRKIEPAEFLN